MSQTNLKAIPIGTRPIIAISFGDPSGIGPEIIAKSLAVIKCNCFPVVFGSITPFRRFEKFVWGRKFLEMIEKEQIGFISAAHEMEYSPGTINPESGKASFDALISAVSFCKDRNADAIVTAPISKKSVIMAGIDFSGHTGFLSKFFDTKTTMMLFRGNFRVALLTQHIPLTAVAKHILQEEIVGTLMRINDALVKIWKINSPKIGVLGLNPHSGEEGEIGDEESTIKIAIKKARELGINAIGPIVPDTAFIPQNRMKFDAYLAMYHDQGLIPLKMTKLRHIVNITLGLPIIRTSPGHGTAFDIAGKGIASPMSFIYAYRFACKLAIEKFYRSSVHERDEI